MDQSQNGKVHVTKGGVTRVLTAAEATAMAHLMTWPDAGEPILAPWQDPRPTHHVTQLKG